MNIETYKQILTSDQNDTSDKLLDLVKHNCCYDKFWIDLSRFCFFGSSIRHLFSKKYIYYSDMGKLNLKKTHQKNGVMP